MLARPATGDRRAVWLAARSGRAKDLKNALYEELSDNALILPADEVNDSGLYGPPTSIIQEKLGDFLVLPFGESMAWYDPRQPDGGFYYSYGIHGGLSPGEMTVPLIGIYL